MRKPENKKIKVYQCSYGYGCTKKYYLEAPTWCFSDVRRIFIKIKDLNK